MSDLEKLHDDWMVNALDALDTIWCMSERPSDAEFFEARMKCMSAGCELRAILKGKGVLQCE